MGFHVEIDDNAEALLNKLRTTPAEVFDRPYKGYLLFLTGCTDQKACEWLSANLQALDSLTGQDIAFAIFARRFDFKLRTMSRTKDRRPKHIGELCIDHEPAPHWRIDRLVKEGRWGMVVDGDELTAMTYAADEIARSLQILDKIPCVVILDAIPSPEAHVIHLSDTICERFIPLLRKSLTEFSKMQGYAELPSQVEHLLALSRAINEAQNLKPALATALRNAQAKLDGIQPPQAVTAQQRQEIHQRLKDARQAVAEASIRRFRTALTATPHKFGYRPHELLAAIHLDALLAALAAFQHSQPTLLALKRALQSIHHANSLLEPERSPYLQHVLAKHLGILAASHSLPIPQEAATDHTLATAFLQSTNTKLVDNILRMIPSEESMVAALESAAQAEHLRQEQHHLDAVHCAQRDLEDFKADPHRRVRDAEASLRKALVDFFHGNPPSLWKATSATLREMKLADYASNVRSRISEIAAGVFAPDFIMKCLEAAAK